MGRRRIKFGAPPGTALVRIALAACLLGVAARGADAGDMARLMKDTVLDSKGQSTELDGFSHVVLAFTALAYERSIADVHYEYRGFGADDLPSFARSILLSTAFGLAGRNGSVGGSVRAVREAYEQSALQSAFPLGPVGNAFMASASFLNPHGLPIDRLHDGLLAQSVREGYHDRPTRFDSDAAREGYLLNVFLTVGTALSGTVTIRRGHSLFDDAVFFGGSKGIDAAGSAAIAAVCAAGSRPVDAFDQVYIDVTRSHSVPRAGAMMIAAGVLSEGFDRSVQETFREFSDASMRSLRRDIDDAYRATRGSLGQPDTDAAAAAAALLLARNPSMSKQAAGVCLLILAIREPVD